MFRSFLFFACGLVCCLPPDGVAQKNSAPVVKITTPQNKSTVGTGTVPYRIKVSDPEDGDSEYGEIATNEIILEARYFSEASTAAFTDFSKPDVNGLASIKKSNCFSCHAFNGRLIAPSFNDLAKKYAFNPQNVALLGGRIRKGSGGVWGSASMPSHEEFTDKEAAEIASWILENGRDANINFYPGAEGAIKITAANTSQKGAYVLSATYTDHGIKQNAQQKNTTKDVVVILIK